MGPEGARRWVTTPQLLLRQQGNVAQRKQNRFGSSIRAMAAASMRQRQYCIAHLPIRIHSEATCDGNLQKLLQEAPALEHVIPFSETLQPIAGHGNYRHV